MFKPEPGAAGNELTPDLAEALGVPSDGGKTWTYKLRSGVKYEDGTAITSKDVKYAVARVAGQGTLVRGPAATSGLPRPRRATRGPVQDKPGVDTKAIRRRTTGPSSST